LQILGDDNVPEAVLAGQPFVKGLDGQPQPLPPELVNLQNAAHKFYDLNKGKYAVTVVAGKANATKREEGSAALGALIPHLPPELAMAVMPDYVRQLSFTGSEKIAAKLEKALPPQLQEQEEGGPDPRLQALQQQVAQLQQVIQSKQAEKQAEAQAKGQIDMQKTMLQEQAQTQRQAATDQVGIEKALIAANASMSNAQAKVDAENFRSYVDASEARLAKLLEFHMTKLTQQFDHQQSTKQHAHEVGMSGLEHQHALAQSAQEHQQALEAGQQAAALAPQPQPGGANGGTSGQV
jgi:hypothetical protein